MRVTYSLLLITYSGCHVDLAAWTTIVVVVIFIKRMLFLRGLFMFFVLSSGKKGY